MEQEKTKGIYLYAMEYALYFGLILIVKMAISPYVQNSSFISLLSLVISVMIPIAGYILTKRFKNLSGITKFSQIFLFGILMYFFASLLSGIFDYVYYQYINPQYFQEQITLLYSTIPQIAKNDPETVEKALSIMPNSPIEMVYVSIFGMLMMGVVYALVVALLLRKKNK